MTNLQNTIRRLKIFLLSLFSLLFIRTSIWRTNGKNLADSRFAQKDFQFARYCHTPLNLRIQLVFWCLSSNRRFGTLTFKFYWTPLPRIWWPIYQIHSNASESSPTESVLLLIIIATFGSSYYKIHTEPHSGPKYGQFAKHCHRPFFHRFSLVFFFVSCTQHFRILTVKF